MTKYPSFEFLVKCALSGTLIMFGCMAAGELFVDPEMFRGFLGKPKIWPLVVLETLIWLLPFFFLIIPFLKRFGPKISRFTLAASWIALGIIQIVVYKLVYYPDNWSVAPLIRADITFGWTLPYVLILFCFIYFSGEYIRRNSLGSAKS